MLNIDLNKFLLTIKKIKYKKNVFNKKTFKENLINV